MSSRSDSAIRLNSDTSLSEFKSLLNSQQDSEIIWHPSDCTAPNAMRPWKKSCHHSQERFAPLLKQAIAEAVQEDANSPFVDKITNQILLDHQMSNSTEVTFKKAKDIFNSLGQRLLATGNVKLWPDLRPVKQADAQNLVKFLLSEVSPASSYFTSRTLKALFVQHDDQFLKEVRSEIQTVLNRLAGVLDSNPSTGEERIATILLGNILALLPFFEIENREELIIPQKIDGEWRRITYVNERIQLTEDYLGSPLFAYGLSPQDNSASPLLLFMGTPFPTASGALLAFWADCAPTYTVGEVIYSHFARRKIENWVTTHVSEEKKCKVFGLSLGGSLALICVSNHPLLFAEAHAYNPTALTPDTLRTYEDNTVMLTKIPKVTLYWQDNDLVPLVGSGWHEDWDLIRLVSKAPQNPYFAHIRAYSGHEKVAAIRADVLKANDLPVRKVLTLSHQILSWPVFAVKSAVIGSKALVHFVIEQKRRELSIDSMYPIELGL